MDFSIESSKVVTNEAKLQYFLNKYISLIKNGKDLQPVSIVFQLNICKQILNN